LKLDTNITTVVGRRVYLRVRRLSPNTSKRIADR